MIDRVLYIPGGTGFLASTVFDIQPFSLEPSPLEMKSLYMLIEQGMVGMTRTPDFPISSEQLLGPCASQTLKHTPEKPLEGFGCVSRLISAANYG